MVWIRCTGVPLDVWNEKCFRELSFPLGTFVRLDVNTKSLARLEFARLLIRTTTLHPISCIRQVKINGLVRDVRFVEELGGEIFKNCECLKARKPVFSDSETSESSYEE